MFCVGRWNDHAMLVVRPNNVFHFLGQWLCKAMFIINGASNPRLVHQDDYRLGRLWQARYWGTSRACIVSELPSRRVRGAVNHRRTEIGPVEGHGLSADYETNLVPAYW